ncbi:unnamed protein product, partial [Effrenium voratum]
RAADLESSALAVLWACSFLGRLRQKARVLVHTAAQRAAAPLDGRSVLALAPTATAAPLRVEMQELLVVNKPPHWQVDSTTERDSGASLGVLLRGLFPQTRILRDAAHSRGFLHR